ncbi:MAG: hypothetical protein ACP5O1_03320 [Phycisphaerae bacterium]
MNEPIDPTRQVKGSELAAKPELVRTLLEEDQLVEFKKRNRFPRRKLSVKLRILLWLLRIYVVVMLLIVALQIYRAMK